MKRILDKLKNYFVVNKNLFLFLSILLIIGIIAGSVFSITINKTDSELVTNYLKNYLNSIKSNEINLLDSFISTSVSDIGLVLFIWLLGFSVIGIPIIFILFFYKSFVFGFTIGSILINYKAKGILLSIIYMIPHHAIKLLIIMMLIIYAYIISVKIIKAILKRTEISFKSVTYKYLKLLGIVIAITTILSLYSSFIVPKLIKLIIPILN